MYVCVCNQITDKEYEDKYYKPHPRAHLAIFCKLKLKDNNCCGSCIKYIKENYKNNKENNNSLTNKE